MITVAQLIAKLQTMPQDLPVEINDNGNGAIYDLSEDDVDLFEADNIALDLEDGDYPVVVLQVNV